MHWALDRNYIPWQSATLADKGCGGEEHSIRDLYKKTVGVCATWVGSSGVLKGFPKHRSVSKAVMCLAQKQKWEDTKFFMLWRPQQLINKNDALQIMSLTTPLSSGQNFRNPNGYKAVRRALVCIHGELPLKLSFFVLKSFQLTERNLILPIYTSTNNSIPPTNMQTNV